MYLLLQCIFTLVLIFIYQINDAGLLVKDRRQKQWKHVKKKEETREDERKKSWWSGEKYLLRFKSVFFSLKKLCLTFSRSGSVLGFFPLL